MSSGSFRNIVIDAIFILESFLFNSQFFTNVGLKQHRLLDTTKEPSSPAAIFTCYLGQKIVEHDTAQCKSGIRLAIDQSKLSILIDWPALNVVNYC